MCGPEDIDKDEESVEEFNRLKSAANFPSSSAVSAPTRAYVGLWAALDGSHWKQSTNCRFTSGFCFANNAAQPTNPGVQKDQYRIESYLKVGLSQHLPGKCEDS